MTGVRKAWNELLDTMKSEEPQTPNERARLTDDDYVAFDAALDIRTGYKRLPPRTIEEARQAVRRKNPIKYAQIMRDYHWLQKQMRKLGLNPDDARDLF